MAWANAVAAIFAAALLVSGFTAVVAVYRLGAP
jgi:hypothetical protein